MEVLYADLRLANNAKPELESRPDLSPQRIASFLKDASWAVIGLLLLYLTEKVSLSIISRVVTDIDTRPRHSQRRSDANRGDIMPRFNNYIIDQLIVPAFVWLFFIGGVVAVAIAVGLILRSSWVFRLFDLVNHSVSTRHATKALEVSRDSSRFVWKYRQPIGFVFVVGAVYSVWGMVTGAGNAAIVSMLNLKLPSGYVFWIVESVRYFLVVSCTAAIIVGILMIISPDTLKAIENVASRWVSTRQVAPNADKMNLTFDKWVAAFPRTAGLIIVLPALGMVMYFGDLLLKLR